MDFEEAVEIAARAHRGQRDKAGEIYLLHPLRVAQAVSPDARVVAVLHDVVEDSEDHSFESLRDAGLGEDEVRALELLTNRDEEADNYARFIERIASAEGRSGALALEVNSRTSETTWVVCPTLQSRTGFVAGSSMRPRWSVCGLTDPSRAQPLAA